MPSIALYTHPDINHHTMPGHPERPERLLAVMERFHGSGLAGDVREILASPAAPETLALAHPSDWVNQLLAAEPTDGAMRLDPDTYMVSGSGRAASLAAGACVEATKSVLAGDFERAFCAVRPPGHHAEIAAALGFCLFNTVAVAAETALQSPGVDRVAILDFDVHHCNGTVDIFRDRPEVLVCSSFQDNFYPHRYLDFENEHIRNTPLAAGTGSDAFRQAIEASWLPAINAHQPDFILVSAGFDAHVADPLAQLELQTEDYAWVTRLIVDLARDHTGGRLVSTMEGGYETAALADSFEAHLAALTG